MKILKMTASFGKLQDSLELHDGLNVLEQPNEAGKSTWCAFLCAMLYGIDTSERKGKQNQLPAKLRYIPWSGAPLEGSMEIEHNGRKITLERTSSARAPMGIFRAYDTLTGQQIPELTAENCGRTLLGVERSVFERTAFLRQAGLAITQDPALEQRLSALVTTGDEENAYSLLHQQLHRLQNECAGARAGQIPKCRARLAEIDTQLTDISQTQAEIMALSAQKQTLTQTIASDNALLERLQQAEQAQKAQQLSVARREMEQRTETAEQLRTQCEGLPPVQKLQELRVQAQQLLAAERAAVETANVPMPQPPVPPAVFRGLDAGQALAQAQTDAARWEEATQTVPDSIPAVFCGLDAGQALARARSDEAEFYRVQRLTPPEPPAGFQGLDGQQAIAQAQADMQRCQELEKDTPGWSIPVLIWVLLLVTGGVLCAVRLYLGIVVTAVIAIMAAIDWRNHRRRQTVHVEAENRRREILNRYLVNDPTELLHIASQYAEELDSYETKKQQAQKHCREILERYDVKTPDGILLKADFYCQQLDARMRSRENQQRQRQELLARYGVTSPGEFVPLAEKYGRSLVAFAAEKAAAEQAQAQAVQRRRETEQASAAFFALIARFSAPCNSFAQADSAIAAAESAYARADSAARARDDAIRHYETLQQTIGDLQTAQAPTEDLSMYDAEEIARRCAANQTQSRQLDQQMFQLRGKLDAVCDPMMLTAEQERLTARLETLTHYSAILDVTAEHLERANDELQTRFSPQIAAQAGQIFSDFTDGRYKKLLLDKNLQVQVAAADSAVLRISAALSCGTVDQLYLAVRLAMVRLLLSGDTPLILDDALINFDDNRAQKALRLLEEEAKTRQVLLFTCHSREKQMTVLHP